MMRTIVSRTYTNVALTVLIVLVAAVLLRPYFSAPAAVAQTGSSFEKNSQQNNRSGDINSQERNAEATEKVAAANEQIAAAIRESAKAQGRIADAIGRLSAVN